MLLLSILNCLSTINPAIAIDSHADRLIMKLVFTLCSFSDRYAWNDRDGSIWADLSLSIHYSLSERRSSDVTKPKSLNNERGFNLRKINWTLWASIGGCVQTKAKQLPFCGSCRLLLVRNPRRTRRTWIVVSRPICRHLHCQPWWLCEVRLPWLVSSTLLLLSGLCAASRNIKSAIEMWIISNERWEWYQ